MNKIIISLLFAVIFLSGLIYAQDKPSRFLKQHKSYFIKDHLNQTEKMLLQSLQSNDTNMNSSAAQTIRELEQVFPDETFSLFISPLSDIVQNEKADTQSRILSALALDELHSDKGDAIIYEVAKFTNNQSVKDICNALAIESFKADEISTKIK